MDFGDITAMKDKCLESSAKMLKNTLTTINGGLKNNIRRKSSMSDNINPDHYKVGIETIDYITSWKMDYLEGNIIKYVSRYNYKNGVEDLKKAQWYLTKLIAREESRNDNS